MRSVKMLACLVAIGAIASMGMECDPQSCGDGVCEGGETAYSCPEDCDWCGNGICGLLESRLGCPQDCGAIDPVCNFDGWCDPGETANNCWVDCGISGFCGDGRCDQSEDGHNCPADCGCPWDFPFSCGNDCWNCAGGVYANCCNNALVVSRDVRYPFYCPATGLFYATLGDLNYWCAGWEFSCAYVGWGC